MAGEGMLPYLYDEEFSTVIIGTELWSGKAMPRGHGRPKNWKIAEGKGTTGGTTTLNGDKPRPFSILFELWEQRHFDQWEHYSRMIESTADGAQPFALPIYHPDLARSRITEFTNAGIGEAIHDGKGGVSYLVQCLEFKPPSPKAAGTPTTAKGSGRTAGGAPAKPDPNAKAKAELAALVAQAKAL